MNVVIYDNHPGPGWQQAFLKATWVFYAWLMRATGAIDAFHAANSFEEALTWLQAKKTPVDSVQYFGHGSAGYVWCGTQWLTPRHLLMLRGVVKETGHIWFRTCSSFQGKAGHDFALRVTRYAGCAAAGHTRIIGVVQGGLRVLHAGQLPHWPVEEGEPKTTWWPNVLKWGPNSVLCFAMELPESHAKNKTTS